MTKHTNRAHKTYTQKITYFLAGDAEESDAAPNKEPPVVALGAVAAAGSAANRSAFFDCVDDAFVGSLSKREESEI